MDSSSAHTSSASASFAISSTASATATTPVDRIDACDVFQLAVCAIDLVDAPEFLPDELRCNVVIIQELRLSASGGDTVLEL